MAAISHKISLIQFVWLQKRNVKGIYGYEINVYTQQQ